MSCAFPFMPVFGTANTAFIFKEVQENYLAKKKYFYVTF